MFRMFGVCLYLIFTTPAMADEWVQLPRTGNEVSVYINAFSIVANGDTRKVWQKNKYAHPQWDATAKKKVAYDLVLLEFDCSNHRQRDLEIVAHFTDGSVAVDKASNSWTYNRPNSISSETEEVVCKR